MIGHPKTALTAGASGRSVRTTAAEMAPARLIPTV
ncbi:uncharacterized protein METZ01_LOCUS99951 [marine metagenome]|uniref:Uncharacterized protein n=1 Tax=marine metagenome TaxID=408172 RepID=A0A381W582_9ZZZZ